MRRALLIAGQLILAGIFLAAAYFKLREPWVQFTVSLYQLKFLPDTWLEPVAKITPWAELVLGLALLSGIMLRWTALIASGVLTAFLSVLTRAWMMGITADCGCFGSGEEPLGPKTLLRDGVMLVLALAVTAEAWHRAKKRARVIEFSPEREPNSGLARAE
jgi:uncharacterized membrane protein YphA (DoxX/SURF4 family)